MFSTELAFIVLIEVAIQYLSLFTVVGNILQMIFLPLVFTVEQAFNVFSWK